MKKGDTSESMNSIDITFSANYWVILLPCIFMAADIVSGLLKAFYSESFESSKMRKGLVHKAGELMILVLFEVATVALNLSKYIPTFIALYIVFMEAYSICENLGSIGVPIPEFVKKTLKQTSEEMDKGDGINGKDSR